MHITRRAALSRGAMLACAMPLALAACASGNPLGTTITVNLAGAQAEAAAILDALNVVASSASISMTPAMQTTVTGYLSELGTAVAAFAALPSGSTSVATFADAVIAAVAKVVGILKLPAATSFAISEGLALLTALVAGLSTITVSHVTSTASAVPGKVSAPIPIPVS